MDGEFYVGIGTPSWFGLRTTSYSIPLLTYGGAYSHLTPTLIR